MMQLFLANVGYSRRNLPNKRACPPCSSIPLFVYSSMVSEEPSRL